MLEQPTGQQIKQIQGALLDAFDHDALTLLVRVHFDQKLEWITPVAGKRDLTTIVADLVTYFAAQQGGLKRLLAAAVDENPGNAALATLQNEWANLDFVPVVLPADHPAVAANERSVAAGGDIQQSTIITGDGNVIYISQETSDKAPYKRRSRRYLLTVFALIFTIWVVISTMRDLYPFQQRLVWMAEAFEFPNATIVHNSGQSLLVGGENIEPGCSAETKALWHYSLPTDEGWKESKVGESLCNSALGYLSNIVSLASLPQDPKTVYALPSHSDYLLVSGDGGAHFEPHEIGFPPFTTNNRPHLLLVSGDSANPVFWIAGDATGLWMYRQTKWVRLDSSDGCNILPPMKVESLLVTDEIVVIGSNLSGLWVSYDAGGTCQQVFDHAGHYVFWELADVSPDGHHRVLALVQDEYQEQDPSLGNWQLIDLCAVSTSCTSDSWTAEPLPVWDASRNIIIDMVVQKLENGDRVWYLLGFNGRLWWGQIHKDGSSGEPQTLPGMHRCIIKICHDLEPVFVNAAPIKAQTEPLLLADNRLYQFAKGSWWRRLWP